MNCNCNFRCSSHLLSFSLTNTLNLQLHFKKYVLLFNFTLFKDNRTFFFSHKVTFTPYSSQKLNLNPLQIVTARPDTDDLLLLYIHFVFIMAASQQFPTCLWGKQPSFKKQKSVCDLKPTYVSLL